MRRAALGTLIVVSVGVFVLWQWLDVSEAILGSAQIAAIDHNHVFVSWHDFGEDIPDQAHVITSSGQLVSADLAGREEVVSVSASNGRVVYATVSDDLTGSIWVADSPRFRARRIVGPDKRVNYGTDLLFSRRDLLVWTGFAGGSKTSISVTDLDNSETRELFQLEEVSHLGAIDDTSLVAFVARPPDPSASQPRGIKLNPETGSIEEIFGHDEVVSAAVVDSDIYLVSKRGQVKTLEQCPGDSGPGNDRNLRPGRLSVLRQGQVRDLNISFKGQPSEVIGVPSRQAIIVTVTARDRQECPISSYFYLDIRTLRRSRLQIPSDASFEPSLDGSMLGFVDDDSLSVRPLLPGGTAKLVNPEGSGSLRELSWMRNGDLYFVSNMNPSGSGTSAPGVWRRKPDGDLVRVFSFVGAQSSVGGAETLKNSSHRPLNQQSPAG